MEMSSINQQQIASVQQALLSMTLEQSMNRVGQQCLNWWKACRRWARKSNRSRTMPLARAARLFTSI